MLKLTVGAGAYDRTWPLIAATIEIDGIELEWEILPPEQAFLRGMIGQEFDVAEMSFSTYLLQRSRGENPYTAIPVFLSRSFRHGAIYVRAQAGIERPQDLRGRRVGVPEWQLTANVWARGMLSDEYGVAVEQIEWLIGGLDQPGRKEKLPVELPPRINHSRIGADQTLWSLMCEGALDAIIAPRAPQALVKGDPRVRRLFTDFKSAEQAYFQKTGIFPIMHLLGIHNRVLDAHADLPARLFEAFDRARAHAASELHHVSYIYATLPWLADHMAETERVMGADYWTYGIEPNRKVIETMCRYSQQQGMIERPLRAEEIFAPVGQAAA